MGRTSAAGEEEGWVSGVTNFYREIHKGIRALLGSLVEQAGKTAVSTLIANGMALRLLETWS